MKTKLIGIAAILLSVGVMAGCGGKKEVTPENCPGHQYVAFSGDEKHVPTDPTCTKNGKSYEKCEVCGDIKEVKVNATGHKYSEDPSQAVAATCTKDGKKVDKCSVCGDTKETKINKVDHDYGEPVVSKNTQGKDVKTQTCKYGCGETKITMSLADGGFERESSGKVQKGTKGTWLVPVAEEKPGASLKFIVSLSSDSHTDRSFYTNHEGASSSDSFESNAENDGTPRFALKVNGADVALTTKTYGELGLTTSAALVEIAKVDLIQGENKIELEHNASTGYRLIFGDDMVVSFGNQSPLKFNFIDADKYEYGFSNDGPITEGEIPTATDESGFTYASNCGASSPSFFTWNFSVNKDMVVKANIRFRWTAQQWGLYGCAELYLDKVSEDSADKIHDGRNDDENIAGGSDAALSTDWEIRDSKPFTITAGDHFIRIKTPGGCTVDFDYIELVPAE